MQYRRSVNDVHSNPSWKIDGWQIQFLFSERLLTAIKHRSLVANWYEDATVALDYMAQLTRCFQSIAAYHRSFGVLPMIGDCLLNEDELRIKDRCIDGEQRTITFVLSA